MTSHVVAFDKLLRDLLPHGRIVGWTQGHYAGYALFQTYFPLSFLVMAALAIALPFHVAFKFGAVLAAVLFPAAVALALRRMRFEAPVPAAGAILSLLVLLNDRQTVWGGNLLSMLTGEIGFSYGYLFFPLFLAELYRSIERGRVSVAAVVLEAAVGFAHGFALMFAGFASLFLVFAGSSFRRAVRVVAATHVFSFLLLGGWIIPLIAYLPVGTSFNDFWTLPRSDDILPPILTPLAFLALARLAGDLVARLRGRRIDDRVLLFAGMAVLALVLFRVGYRLGVTNIRFLPFWLVGLLMLAASALEKTRDVERATWVVPIALAAIVALIAPPLTLGVERGAWWNFSGLGFRSGASTLARIADRLRGDLSQPRVYAESTEDIGFMGTQRIFDVLPYLARRQTLQGIYTQSAFNPPVIVFLESELSTAPSAIMADYHNGHRDAPRGIDHLDLFNARTLIVYTEPMKKRLAADSRVRLVEDIDSFCVYERVGGDSSFAVPIECRPLVYAGANAKMFAWRHFVAHPRDEPVVVLPYGRDQPPAEWRRCGEDASALEVTPLDAAGESRPVVTCAMNEEQVRIHTDRPGWPIRLSMGFHPRWKVEGGRAFACTPGFFLIVPDREDVVLRFGDTPVEWLGRATTVLAFVMLAFVFARRNRIVPVEPDAPVMRSIAGAAAFIAIVTIALAPTVSAWRVTQEHLWWGDRAMDANKPEEAIAEYTIAADQARRDPAKASLLCKALECRAIVADGSSHKDLAARDYRELAELFPESEWAPEAAFEAGIAAYNAHRDSEAVRWFHRSIALDPFGSPARSAQDFMKSAKMEAAGELSDERPSD